VSAEERRMNHFEQGLRGNIKSIIAGQTFENFQAMYQKAVKIIRVLEESESENQALNLEKQKRDSHRPGFQVGIIKGSDQVTLKGMENTLCIEETNLIVGYVVKTMMDRAFFGVYDVLNVGRRAIRGMNAQRRCETRTGQYPQLNS